MNLENKPEINYTVWQNPELAQNFVQGIRGAVPLAQTQIELLLRLIKLTQTEVINILDLGCGSGILGKAILEHYSNAKGIFVDLSETMLNIAKDNLKSEFHHFIQVDFAQENWVNSLPENSFNVIVSGFAIHHLPDDRKKQLYQEIYSLLNKGGIFLNLEHILSLSSLGEKAFEQLFIDCLYNYHQQENSTQSKEEIAQKYYNRDDKNANLLTSVETQCNWLKEIGFHDVDCYFKILEIGIFGGIK